MVIPSACAICREIIWFRSIIIDEKKDNGPSVVFVVVYYSRRQCVLTGSKIDTNAPEPVVYIWLRWLGCYPELEENKIPWELVDLGRILL